MDNHLSREMISIRKAKVSWSLLRLLKETKIHMVIIWILWQIDSEHQSTNKDLLLILDLTLTRKHKAKDWHMVMLSHKPRARSSSKTSKLDSPRKTLTNSCLTWRDLTVKCSPKIRLWLTWLKSLEEKTRTCTEPSKT